MMQELKKFYDELHAKQMEVLNTDVETIVAERVAQETDRIRNEVNDEIKANSMIFEIKMEAIADAMKVIEANKPKESEPVTDDTEII